jgi:hypothetical protein
VEFLEFLWIGRILDIGVVLWDYYDGFLIGRGST